MAVPLHCGRRLASQTLRMTAGKTYSSGSAFKSTSLLPLPHQLSFLPEIPNRSFSNSRSNDSPRKDLMDYPRVSPNFFSAAISFCKSLFFQQYIIARYDRDFTLDLFRQGARGALFTVSEILASDDISPLKENNLVDAAAYREIKANHDSMNSLERRQLRVTEQDLRQSHIHEVGILEEEHTGLKAVEIMVVFVVFKMEPDQPPPSPREMLEKVILCNYRFYRDYTNPQNPSPWILNVVNHFSPVGQVDA